MKKFCLRLIVTAPIVNCDVKIIRLLKKVNNILLIINKFIKYFDNMLVSQGGFRVLIESNISAGAAFSLH